MPSVHSVHMSIVKSQLEIEAKRVEGTLRALFLGSLMKILFSIKFIKRLKKENQRVIGNYVGPDLENIIQLEESIVIIMPHEILVKICNCNLIWDMRVKPFNINDQYFKEVVSTFFIPSISNRISHSNFFILYLTRRPRKNSIYTKTKDFIKKHE